MKSSGLQCLLLIILFVQGCSNNTTNIDTKVNPLQDAYKYFDELSQNEFHFADIEHRLNIARSGNKTDEINTITKEFEKAQDECIKKMETKFPIGSIKLPFEQVGRKDTLTVKSIYVSGFMFPWNTAPSICYYFTVEYELQKKDIWFAWIPMTFLDSEGDFLDMCDVPGNTNGKSKFQVRTQDSFRIFSKIVIN